MVIMSRKHSKILFYGLIGLYFAYILALLLFPHTVTFDMSSPLVELYGGISTLVMIIALYAHAFDKAFLPIRLVEVIIVNTIVCALWSYIETARDDFALMSVFEIIAYTALYLILYPPIIAAMADLRSR